jgi:hypothetical protein
MFVHAIRNVPLISWISILITELRTTACKARIIQNARERLMPGEGPMLESFQTICRINTEVGKRACGKDKTAETNVEDRRR